MMPARIVTASARPEKLTMENRDDIRLLRFRSSFLLSLISLRQKVIGGVRGETSAMPTTRLLVERRALGTPPALGMKAKIPRAPRKRRAATGPKKDPANSHE